MIAAINIVFLNDLTQLDYENNYYDFHNNYICTQIEYSKKNLIILAEYLESKTITTINFINAELTFAKFHLNTIDKNLVIDSMYRGRYEIDGSIIDKSPDNKGYFYLEFSEEQKIEFWADIY